MGKGSYATVERATDRETGEEWAIKEFSKMHLRRTAALEAQRRERYAARGRGRGRGGFRGGGRGGGGMVGGTGEGRAESDSEGPDNVDLIRTEIAIMKKVSWTREWKVSGRSGLLTGFYDDRLITRMWRVCTK